MKVYQVDAFSSRPFSGNPAAVCILTHPVNDALMQQIAAEMNLSETAFLLKQNTGFDLRWFTPAIEVDLCGHATLASAHVLWESGLLDVNTMAQFQTRSGLLKARHSGRGIELDFPSQPPTKVDAPARLIQSLNIEPIYEGYNGSDYLLVLDHEDQIHALSPDFQQMGQIGMRGVIVTARSNDPRYDFVSRFFAPAAGIDEDPVTGSAHCCLAPYWSQQLQKSEMKAFQASPRGGTLGVRVLDDRVLLTGQAVTVMEGVLKLKIKS